MSIKGKCFVIMGYGVKTDYASGRKLDLDKTYRTIIKPAVEESGLECIRADEIRHSGIIDVPMYWHLKEADVVIADLSTSNTNTFYELGVRHALRPKTTIVIAENKLKPPFDIDHTIIHSYQHLESGIDYEEVLRFKEKLMKTIDTILKSEDIDSPVYTYLNDLTPPEIKKIAKQSTKVEHEKETLSSILMNAKSYMDNNKFIQAKTLFEQAKNIDRNNSYVIQQLALSTYKSKHPNNLEALKSALSIIKELELQSSTDPETLGIAGAIYKRLWEETSNMENLIHSIHYYEKGFYIKNDYYNGINLAYLLNVSSNQRKEKYEAIADNILANRVRKEVVKICLSLIEADDFENRDDSYWIAATLEEAYFGLGMEDNYRNASEDAESLSNNNWERETTREQIINLSKLKDISYLISLFS